MKRLRVLVVDDSAFSRRTITKMLGAMEGVEVVGYAINGEEGIRRVIALKPDLVTLDLEMPGMDGFTLLRILATRFSMPVIVISALGGADKVFKALELGALDFIAKPSSGASLDLLTIGDDLQRKVRQIAEIRPGNPRRRRTAPAEKRGESNPWAGSGAGSGAPVHQRLDLVAIGASTGGPPALQGIFSALGAGFPFAVIVSQHMPAGFTRAFAERLNRAFPFPVKEAEDGDELLAGRILITPGGMNLVLEGRGGRVIARTVPPAAADRYVPSVDVMLESCAPIYGDRMAAVILTGMGNDGCRGVLAVKGHGGYIIAESEESAVVYGMPREAVATGVVDCVAPLNDIALEIFNACTIMR